MAERIQRYRIIMEVRQPLAAQPKPIRLYTIPTPSSFFFQQVERKLASSFQSQQTPQGMPL